MVRGSLTFTAVVKNPDRTALPDKVTRALGLSSGGAAWLFVCNQAAMLVPERGKPGEGTVRKSNALALLLLATAAGASAQNIAPAPPPPSTYAAVMALEVPVTSADITDRPYRVVAEVSKEVRRATVFSKNASDDKVFRELWEEAQEHDADAVVNAHLGDARVTALSWGSRRATGQAIKFLTDEEIAQRAAGGN